MPSLLSMETAMASLFSASNNCVTAVVVAATSTAVVPVAATPACAEHAGKAVQGVRAEALLLAYHPHLEKGHARHCRAVLQRQLHVPGVACTGFGWRLCFDVHGVVRR